MWCGSKKPVGAEEGKTNEEELKGKGQIYMQKCFGANLHAAS